MCFVFFRCINVIIIDFEMKFDQSVSVSEVLNVLKTAAKENNLDGFKVDPNSIAQTSTPTTGTSSTKSTVSCFYFHGSFYFCAPYHCHLGKFLVSSDNFLTSFRQLRGGYLGLMVSAINSGSSGPGGALGGDIVLCYWERHCFLTQPL